MTSRSPAALAVFVASIFLSAFLLFSVQPLAAKLLLPRFGGSPAVWNTSLVFFQTALLLGYLYAHALAQWSDRRRGTLLHAAVVTLPLLLVAWTGGLGALSEGAGTGPGSAPSVQVLWGLTFAIGAPFFVLSSNSSLVQHWLSESGARHGDDPYWLYAASNLGSLLALAAFPFVLEPLLGAGLQRTAWTFGYAAWAALTLVMLWAWVGRRPAGADPRSPESAGDPGAAEATGPAARVAADASPSWGRQIRWAVLAGVASSLLLSMTMRITTDVASVPLFWVLPLAIYLVTFIVAFASSDRIPMDAVVRWTAVMVAISLGLVMTRRAYDVRVVIAASMVTLLLGALFCHLALARDRPHPRHLTRFYLWIAAGGAAGGALNSLVAPFVFDSVAEYPLTLAAVAWLLPDASDPRSGPAGSNARFGYRPHPLIGALALAGLMAPVFVGPAQEGLVSPSLWAAAAASVALLALALARYRALFAIVASVTAALVVTGVGEPQGSLARERSFFGVSRVWEEATRTVLMHGTTLHGSQSRDPDLRGVAGSYYHESGPMGSLLANVPAGGKAAVIGLGAGELAAVASTGVGLVFYEIDPVVARLASRHFTYLADSRADIAVRIADGRIGIARDADAQYRLIVVDAFSSDHVPVHLLTAEALDLYLDKLTIDGVLVLHISSRHADLARVFRGYARSSGRPVAFADFRPTPAMRRQGATRALAVALARDPGVVERLQTTLLWEPLPPEGPSVEWTDDYSNLLGVLRWGAPAGGEAPD